MGSKQQLRLLAILVGLATVGHALIAFVSALGLWPHAGWLDLGSTLPVSALFLIVTGRLISQIELQRQQSEEQYRQLTARIDEVVASRTAVLQALLDGSRDLAATLDLDELLARILNRLKDLVDYTGTGVILRYGDQWVSQASSVPFDNRKTQSRRLDSQNAMLKRIVASRQPVVIHDLAADPVLQNTILSIPGPAPLTDFAYIRSWMGTPLIADDRVIGLLFVDHRDPDWFTAERQHMVEVFANQMALALKNARLYCETEKRLTAMCSLQRVTSALLQTNSLENLLEIVCSEACALAGASGAAIYALGLTGLEMAMDRGSFDFSCPAVVTAVEEACRQGSPCLNDDPQSLAALIAGSAGTPSAILIIPLRINESSVGALCTAKATGAISDDDVSILSLLADTAAMALNSAQLSLQAQQLAIVKERQKLAMHLHDSVSQALYSAMLFTDSVELAVKAGRHQSGLASLSKAQETLDEAMKSLRMLVFELRPPALEDGLFPALEQRLYAVESRVGLKTELLIQNDQRLPAEVEQEAYWIAVEALNNVVKHAGAGKVSVSLRFHADGLDLEVLDDGMGFEPDCLPRGGGLGIAGMRERAASIGSVLAIDSRPGAGTKVKLRVICETEGVA